MTTDELHHQVEHLRALPRETEWVEFKHDNSDPQEIGEYISALSNGVALHRQGAAFVLWGIEDGTHNLLGTAFRPRQSKVGNEELENWLLRLLTPRIDFRIHEGEVSGKHVVLLEIEPASHQPVSFAGIEYIRVGTYKEAPCNWPAHAASIEACKLFQDRGLRFRGYEAPCDWKPQSGRARIHKQRPARDLCTARIVAPCAPPANQPGRS